MSYDVGDPIPLTFTVRDANGDPGNATACVLTITLPDMTTVTPAVTGGQGVYTPDVPYLATLPGRHAVSWVATGVNACTSSDVFNVLPADPGFIISLADARRGIRLVGNVNDEDLRDLLADVTPLMEYLVGPILRKTRVETYDGGSVQIDLLGAPLISVTSVVESYGSNYQRTLTVQDIFAGSSLDAFGYTVDLLSGTVTRRSAGAAVPFVEGKRNIQVTYVSGRAVINGNILRATRYLVRHLWQIEQQRVPLVNGQPEPTTYILGYAVPNAVIEMCGGDISGPSVA
jgi:hypothetical protein